MTFACVSLNLACRLVPTFPKADQPSLYLGDAYWRKAVAAFGESCRCCGHVLASLTDPQRPPRVHRSRETMLVWTGVRCIAGLDPQPYRRPLFDQLVGGGQQ